MSGRVLVAGVGNIFRSDDGFGCAVLRWLQDRPERWPAQVVVRDFGIAAVHLAYELLDGYDDVVLVDAMRRGAAVGSLYVVDADVPSADAGAALAVVDAHDLAPEAVLALLPALQQTLGGTVGRVTVVGCEPASVADGMGLSAAVQSVVPQAGRLVVSLVEAALARGQAGQPEGVRGFPSRDAAARVGGAGARTVQQVAGRR